MRVSELNMKRVLGGVALALVAQGPWARLHRMCRWELFRIGRTTTSSLPIRKIIFGPPGWEVIPAGCRIGISVIRRLGGRSTLASVTSGREGWSGR